MKTRYVAFAVVLLGASIEIAIRQIQIAAYWGGFELRPEEAPSVLARLDWLWTALAVVLPGLVVGLLVSRHAAWLSALAYFLGYVADFLYHDGEHEVPHQFLPGLRHLPSMWKVLFIVTLVGAILGFVASWLRRRLRPNMRIWTPPASRRADRF